MELTDKILTFVRKYRFVLLILLIGVGLMLIPFGERKETSHEIQTPAPLQTDMALQLTEILSKVDGAGEVSVMLSIGVGQSTVYQTDENISGGSSNTTNRDTVIITNENRAQSGLVQHIISPVYRGAIIVCDGADDPVVCLNITQAVSRITGLGMDKISVLKMK